jgi:membrane protease YdiL (CAAX protease family)
MYSKHLQASGDDKSSSTSQKCHQVVTWFVLSLLLFLRIPYTFAIIYFLPIENQNGAAIYEVCTYILTLFLIWWERDSLAQFHMDKTALIMILFLRPFQTLILSYWQVDSPLKSPSVASLLIWSASIVLAISLWRSRIKLLGISASTWIWLGIGIVVGITVSILENFVSFRSMLSSNSFSSIMMKSASLALLYHLGFAPINEEPLFRGFLWGMLRQWKWKEDWILIFQAILFTSAHIYFAKQYPFMFWVLIPLAALLFGVLTMRSRSIAPAIWAHGMINGSVYVLVASLFSRL